MKPASVCGSAKQAHKLGLARGKVTPVAPPGWRLLKEAGPRKGRLWVFGAAFKLSDGREEVTIGEASLEWLGG